MDISGKGSLFKKYFLIYAVTLLICVFMLGMVFLYFASQYFKDANKGTLAVAALKGVEATERNYIKNYGKVLTRDELEDEYSLIYHATDVLIFFCDIDGMVEICGEGEDCPHMKGTIPAGIRETILLKREYYEAGNLGGFIHEARFTYACPVIMGGAVRGYIFASKSLEGLFTFLYQIITRFALSALAAFVLSFVVIYYATRMLTKPLQKISFAAKRFGDGDYSVRVDVPDNDEIGELAKVFNNMAESVSGLEMTRRSFVANVSHELRTPMTTIAGFIDGILDGTISKTEQPYYLQVVSDEVKRLSRLTSSLLTIARMEAGEQAANIDSYNAWDSLLNVMWNMEQRISEKNIEVKEMEVIPRFVYCDPDMLHQVIYNLMDNAVKFTPEGGYIRVSITAGWETTNIYVTNSGAGIDQAYYNRIFERFYKSDSSRSLDKGGTGLGLYIVRTLLNRMSGRISVTSEKDVETSFIITLRTAPEQKQREHNDINAQTEKEKRGLANMITRGLKRRI